MMKRASDDQISNGNLMETDPNSDVKKAKMEGKASRVLHIRGVPMDATEGEVIQLGLPFGRMTNLVMARKKNQALLEMADVATAQAMVTYYSERPPSIRGGSMMGMGSSMGNMGSPPPTTGCVVIVSNLDEGKVDPDAIFTLFGVYGIVLRVKILFNKKDTALVQFSDPIQAQNAISSLDGAMWNGKNMKVSISKHATVQLPRETLPDAWMTKDFSNSLQHRAKNPNAKTYNNVYPPTSTLHLSNVPETVSADELTDMFSQYGKVLAFRFFENNRKMALIQMENQQQAIESLVGLHNHHFDGSGYIRVSFTKSII